VSWQLNGLVELHWRHWDNEWAVFDVGSGQTHQMDTLIAVTLMVIEAGAIDLPELIALVASELQLTNDSQLSIAITDVLKSLTDIGVLEASAA
jgi:PqqD family protein of HPr-rel-A system